MIRELMCVSGKRRKACFERRGESQSILASPLVFFFLLILFLFLMSVYVHQQRDGAAVWEEFYAKQLVSVLNSAKPGDSIALDVHKATEIAGKHRLDFDSIFSFPEQEVCVKLSSGRKTCQKHFTAVSVVETKMLLGVPENVLEFKVIERKVKE